MKQQPQQYLEQLSQLLQQLEQAAPSLQQEIDATARDIDTIDSSDELSEETSLELQMSMDRRSKLMDTLGNILKNINDTENSIVQNLK